MAWTLLLARQGARAAHDTLEEFAEGDGVLDHLFRIIMCVAVAVVAPALILTELARQALMWLVGGPVTSRTAAIVLVICIGAVVAAVVGRRSTRRRGGAGHRSRDTRLGPAADVPGRPLDRQEAAALDQIVAARGPVAVDAAVRAQDYAICRALSRHGYIAFHIESARWYLR